MTKNREEGTWSEGEYLAADYDIQTRYMMEINRYPLLSAPYAFRALSAEQAAMADFASVAGTAWTAAWSPSGKRVASPQAASSASASSPRTA